MDMDDLQIVETTKYYILRLKHGQHIFNQYNTGTDYRDLGEIIRVHETEFKTDERGLHFLLCITNGVRIPIDSIEYNALIAKISRLIELANIHTKP